MAEDQTPEEWREKFQDSQGGTAVLLLVGAGGSTYVTIRPISGYAECVLIGQSFAAYKWVPREVASYAEVQESRCRLPGEACVKTCTAYGCVCNPHKGQCTDQSSNALLPPIVPGFTFGGTSTPQTKEALG